MPLDGSVKLRSGITSRLVCYTKSSRNEQCAVIRFMGKGLNANEIHSEIRTVYVDKRSTRPAILRKWLASGTTSVNGLYSSRHCFLNAAFRSLRDGNKCLNELGTVLKKRN